MLYRKQTTAMPTKNSADEAESPTRCVVPTVWLQIVAFPWTRGTWLNLDTETTGSTPRTLGNTNTSRRHGFPPERVVEVGGERLVAPIAAKERYDVTACESAAATESKYGRELFGQTRDGRT